MKTLVALAIGCLVGLAGCSHSTVCSGVGTPPPGIWVVYRQVVHDHPHRRLIATACVLGSCATHRIAGRYAAGMYSGSDRWEERASGLGGHPVLLRFRITDADGRMVFRGRTMVTPQLDQPNGPGCGPAVWIGEASATGRHALRPVRLRL